MELGIIDGAFIWIGSCTFSFGCILYVSLAVAVNFYNYDHRLTATPPVLILFGIMCVTIGLIMNLITQMSSWSVIALVTVIMIVSFVWFIIAVRKLLKSNYGKAIPVQRYLCTHPEIWKTPDDRGFSFALRSSERCQNFTAQWQLLTSLASKFNRFLQILCVFTNPVC